MALLRTDIERALDELISNEEGMRFQALAVVIAKQKCPELIASERRNDGGLDAYVPASLSPDKKAKGLACSNTAAITKIKGDAAEAKKHFPDIEILIFATPRKVPNTTIEKWTEAIREEYGLELVVITREDIITSLMMPANVGLCRSMLHMDVPVEPDDAGLLANVREAVAEAARTWRAHPRLANRPIVPLRAEKLDDAGKPTSETLDTGALRAALAQARRIALEAPGGGGKTTTLVQLATQNQSDSELFFLVDLPAWVRSGNDVLEFIANTRPFRARNISASNLARLAEREHFSFLLNGWNEISESQADSAVIALRQLERDFPAAGMRLIETSEEHRPQLQAAPLSNHAQHYLTELAARMTDRGEVEIADEAARSIVQSVSAALQTNGQIAAVPNSGTILHALCAHYVLEQIDYPAVGFRFQHQQFQEFYAARFLVNALARLLASGDAPADRAFAASYINKPLWEEPIRMLAEEIRLRVEENGTTNGDAVASGVRLIRLTLGVDPILAGDLCRLCGLAVWAAVRADVARVLRDWYAVDDVHHRQLALAAMLATGYADFADILIPLLTDKNRQVRVAAYDAGNAFYPTSIATDWRPIVERWDEDARANFVFEVTHRGLSADIGESFAMSDSSVKVRAQAIQDLSWIGATEALTRITNALENTSLESALTAFFPETVPEALLPRLVAANRRILARETQPLERIRHLLRGAEFGDEIATRDLMPALNALALPLDQYAAHAVGEAVKIVSKHDPAWANSWVAAKLLDGTISGDQWRPFVISVPQQEADDLINRLATRELQFREASAVRIILSASATPALSELKEQGAAAANAQIAHRLKDLAVLLAVLDGQASADFVIETLTPPSHWDAYARMNGMRALLLSGAALTLDSMLTVLDPAIEHTLSHGLYNDQNLSLLVDCLELLLFSDDPARAIARIEEVVARFQYRPYHFRDLVAALGHARSESVVPFLTNLARAEGGLQNMDDTWIEALGRLNVPAARRALLSFIDPELPWIGVNVTFDHRNAERFAAYVAGWARQDPALTQRLIGFSETALTPTQRQLLPAIYSELGSDDAMLALLNPGRRMAYTPET